MAEAKVYPKGINFFNRRENAPEWVKGEVTINPKELIEWMRSNMDLMVENEKYGKQYRLTATDKGLSVNTWKPENKVANVTPKKQTPPPADDFADSLPF